MVIGLIGVGTGVFFRGADRPELAFSNESSGTRSAASARCKGGKLALYLLRTALRADTDLVRVAHPPQFFEIVAALPALILVDRHSFSCSILALLIPIRTNAQSAEL